MESVAKYYSYAYEHIHIHIHTYTYIPHVKRRHMDKTPNEYIRWRYAGGEDREAIAKDTMKISDAELELQKTVRSRRFEVLRCLHAIDATRGDETRAWVVFFLILRPFGPSRDRETPFRPNRLKFGPETTHELVR